MSGPNEKGGAATPPATSRSATPGQVGRYHGPSHPRKTVRFIVDGQPKGINGKLGAFLQALIAAGSEGVSHIEVMPWMYNASDAAMILGRKVIRIEGRKGRPFRWILLSDVREVLP